MPPRPTPADLALIDPDGRFMARLAADQAALRQAVEMADRPAIGRLAHGLAGAAGTFGYDEVGERAIALDELLTAAHAGLRAVADAQMEEAVAALFAALTRATQQ